MSGSILIAVAPPSCAPQRANRIARMRAPAGLLPGTHGPIASNLADVSICRPARARGANRCHRRDTLAAPAPALSLDHVNIYLIENEGGWTAFDRGLGTEECKQAWEARSPAR